MDVTPSTNSAAWLYRPRRAARASGSFVLPCVSAGNHPAAPDVAG